MKSTLIVTVLLIIVFASVTTFSVGASEKRSFDITSLTIRFDKTDAIFTIDYDIGGLPKMFILLLEAKVLSQK